MALDMLNRSNYVDFLCNVVNNCENYRRDQENMSYIFAVDSPWGTGKTFLMNMLAEKLSKNGMKVVKYNAWRNDYSRNPLESLFYTIISSQEFERDKVDAVFNALVVVVKRVFTRYIPLVSYVSDGLEVYQKEKKQPYELFETEQKIINEFSQLLRNCIGDSAKLVIIIDELDRCKPTFAIDLLEIVKHLFNVPNLVFIFAMDIGELSCGIRAVYGDDFGAAGYLCRFFDYMTKIPQPDLRSYITESLSHIEDFPNCQVEDLTKDTGKVSFIDAIIDYLLILVQNFDLSLRDINTIIVSYRILFDTLLRNYDNIGAHYIYMYFLVLKYKRPEVYGRLFGMGVGLQASYDKELVIDGKLKRYFYISSALKYIATLRTIGSSGWRIENDNRGIKGVKEIHIVGVSGDNGSYSDNEYGAAYTFSDNVNNWSSLGGVLFVPDIRKWEQIKNLTFAQYLHQQLENYNFVEG